MASVMDVFPGTAGAFVRSPVTVARERAGLTVIGLAERSGLSITAVVNAEEPGRAPRASSMQAIATALELDVVDLFDCDDRLDLPDEEAGAPAPSRLVWPPPAQHLQMVVQAYRCAGDALGAAELLADGTHEATVRNRLNQAGCAPRPRGGSRSDGVMSLAAYARRQFGNLVSIQEAVEAANDGRLPGAFHEELDCPVLRVRWAWRPVS